MVHIVASLLSTILLAGSAWLVIAMLDEKRDAILAALGVVTADRAQARRRVRVRSVAAARTVARREESRRFAA